MSKKDKFAKVYEKALLKKWDELLKDVKNKNRSLEDSELIAVKKEIDAYIAYRKKLINN